MCTHTQSLTVNINKALSILVLVELWCKRKIVSFIYILHFYW